MRNHESTSLIRHLEVLRAVTEAVSRSLDLSEVVQRSLVALTHVTGHEIASLHLISTDGHNMLLRGDRGLSDELRRVNLELPLGEGLIGLVALSGIARRVDDASTSEDLLPAARAAVSTDGIRGFVCVPIRARHRILGTLSLGRQTEDRFTDEEVALLECVADHIGLALDNARLYGEINRQLEDLRRAQVEVVRAERLSAVNGLAAGVAHEINNPLTIIMAQLHLLAQGELDPQIEEAMGVIDSASKRAASIVRDLILFAEHRPPRRSRCQVGEQVREVVAFEEARLE
ncbi:MAG TPA: GAF domain-containing protein, partial [Verrucomicrobiae bacterium]|nr:GAF domain-containing protein [Verrucomicrobiae bacterium]